MKPLLGCGIAAAVLLVVVIGLVVWGVGYSNQFVAADQDVKEKWAQVQNVYQRRADLIPNLVETVKGFATQERTVLEGVTRARAAATGIQATPELINDPVAFKKFQQAQAELGSQLGRLLAVVENYPNLKSDQNFLALQSQLEGTENRIAVERRRFNESVRAYNVRVTQLPGRLIAGFLGYKERPFFEAAAGSDVAPKVKF
jgi:LemA protein